MTFLLNEAKASRRFNRKMSKMRFRGRPETILLTLYDDNMLSFLLRSFIILWADETRVLAWRQAESNDLLQR